MKHKTRKIIKSLKACLNSECKNCDFYGFYNSDCTRQLKEAALHALVRLSNKEGN